MRLGETNGTDIDEFIDSPMFRLKLDNCTFCKERNLY